MYAGGGDGTFADPVDYTTSALPVAVGAADIDGDEVTDVLVSSLKENSVTVFPGHLGRRAHRADRTDGRRRLRGGGRRPDRRRHPGPRGREQQQRRGGRVHRVLRLRPAPAPGPLEPATG
ncbi:FG-GAP repeat domain-containing protein [Streptomyces griseoruber]|uniref:FG-GAP repeat domain-containing protein n=1 Tax=Streptomyces griseoruber TaxID=1943 RepID=UPI003CC7D6C6